MDELLNNMKDIRDLDPVTWWPLAPGWWVMLLAAICALLVVFLYGFFKKRRHSQWSFQARQELSALRNRTKRRDEKQLIAEFSQLLRRIMVQKYGRISCAGLTGQAWLEWLEKNDPTKFKWSDYANVLVHNAYAPEVSMQSGQLSTMIDAVEKWLMRK